jgi:putative glutamine amidotransferase
MRATIGVTTSEQPGHRGPQAVVNGAYLAAVERAGATPLLLTPAHDEESLRDLLSLCDGLLLTGGEDVDPARYGEPPHPELDTVSVARDEMELRVLRDAMERGMPVLAVCRGIQLLNVAFGGTLVQDLPSQRPEGLHHVQEAPITARWHDARVQPGSRLAGLLGAEELPVNSFHHQAINRVGTGLRPVAWADDGVVEGVETGDGKWVVGVQWHPERGDPDAPEDDPDRRLLRGFVEAAEEGRKGKR